MSTCEDVYQGTGVPVDGCLPVLSCRCPGPFCSPVWPGPVAAARLGTGHASPNTGQAGGGCLSSELPAPLPANTDRWVLISPCPPIPVPAFSPVLSSSICSLCFSSLASRDSTQNLKPCSASSALNNTEKAVTFDLWVEGSLDLLNIYCLTRGRCSRGHSGACGPKA